MLTATPLGTSFPTPRHAGPARRRPRRRWAFGLWGLTGLGALALGTAYASGLPTIGGTTTADTPTATRVVDLSGASAGSSLYGNAVTSSPPLGYTWSGRWGSFATDQSMFYVDLAGNTGTYAAEVALTNAGALANWYALQLRLEIAPVASQAACTAHDFDGTQTPKVLYTDTVDASVTFTNLDPTQKWCIGVSSADGKDPAGTYLRRVSTGSLPTYPQFVASIARTA